MEAFLVESNFLKITVAWHTALVQRHSLCCLLFMMMKLLGLYVAQLHFWMKDHNRRCGGIWASWYMSKNGGIWESMVLLGDFDIHYCCLDCIYTHNWYCQLMDLIGSLACWALKHNSWQYIQLVMILLEVNIIQIFDVLVNTNRCIYISEQPR